LRFELTRDPEEFAAAAGAFLLADPERNLLATILANARRSADPGVRFASGRAPDGSVAVVALRTAPRPLIVTALEDRAADALVAAWLGEDPDLPAVYATEDAARAFAAAWARRTGGTTACRARFALHDLPALVQPPRPARGALRPGSIDELELLVAWQRAFSLEAGVDMDVDPRPMVEHRLARGLQFVWDDGGAVSAVAHTPLTAGTVRIGPVYTPPEHRSHGYATSAVAEVSRRGLARGAERCMLFTDLGNPTSNKIYADVGYRRIGDWEEHALIL
jgi:predicted GNAT family acetyltransferase